MSRSLKKARVYKDIIRLQSQEVRKKKKHLKALTHIDINDIEYPYDVYDVEAKMDHKAERDSYWLDNIYKRRPTKQKVDDGWFKEYTFDELKKVIPDNLIRICELYLKFIPDSTFFVYKSPYYKESYDIYASSNELFMSMYNYGDEDSYTIMIDGKYGDEDAKYRPIQLPEPKNLKQFKFLKDMLQYCLDKGVCNVDIHEYFVYPNDYGEEKLNRRIMLPKGATSVYKPKKKYKPLKRECWT